MKSWRPREFYISASCFHSKKADIFKITSNYTHFYSRKQHTKARAEKIESSRQNAVIFCTTILAGLCLRCSRLELINSRAPYSAMADTKYLCLCVENLANSLGNQVSHLLKKIFYHIRL